MAAIYLEYPNKPIQLQKIGISNKPFLIRIFAL